MKISVERGKTKPIRSFPKTLEEAHPPSVFEYLYEPLGKITFVFADLEAQITASLNELLGTSPIEGMALEWFMQSITQRIELFYFLAYRSVPTGQLLKSA